MALVIIQARTNSSRLPGKVLLPIAGLPLVVLAARRAANAGANVIVATSDEPSDDVLAKVLADAGIQCFRGSLENTLDRMVGALAGYDDDILVFRLTADNVFPDGTLLKEMEEDFLA
jgi:spore coat polysaccharide biosynthesis protein SpsF (cytidylyltransferase family)